MSRHSRARRRRITAAIAAADELAAYFAAEWQVDELARHTARLPSPDWHVRPRWQTALAVLRARRELADVGDVA